MSIERPRGLRAGFHAHLSHAGVAGLAHAGDQHAPTTWFIPDHTHDVWELYLQLDGPATSWKVEGEQYHIPPRGLLAVPPGTRHHMAERATEPYHFYFAAFDADLLLSDAELAAPWRCATAFSIGDASELITPFEAFLHEVTTTQPLRIHGLRHAAVHLLVEATRLLVPGPRQHDLAIHPVVTQARRLLDNDLSTNLSVDDLAQQVHLSPGYLTELFTAQIGEPPGRYRQRVRLRRAQTLLAETDLSITEIASSLGFSSPQHLATTFRQHLGLTPRAYRRNRRATATPGTGWRAATIDD